MFVEVSLVNKWHGLLILGLATVFINFACRVHFVFVENTDICSVSGVNEATDGSHTSSLSFCRANMNKSAILNKTNNMHFTKHAVLRGKMCIDSIFTSVYVRFN